MVSRKFLIQFLTLQLGTLILYNNLQVSWVINGTLSEFMIRSCLCGAAWSPPCPLGEKAVSHHQLPGFSMGSHGCCCTGIQLVASWYLSVWLAQVVALADLLSQGTVLLSFLRLTAILSSTFQFSPSFSIFCFFLQSDVSECILLSKQ